MLPSLFASFFSCPHRRLTPCFLVVSWWCGLASPAEGVFTYNPSSHVHFTPETMVIPPIPWDHKILLPHAGDGAIAKQLIDQGYPHVFALEAQQEQYHSCKNKIGGHRVKNLDLRQVLNQAHEKGNYFQQFSTVLLFSWSMSEDFFEDLIAAMHPEGIIYIFSTPEEKKSLESSMVFFQEIFGSVDMEERRFWGGGHDVLITLKSSSVVVT